jgi:WD40 repeat protein
MRYLATGSEDRTARIIDLIGGKELSKLSGQHKDVVSCVAWNPIFPQLVTSSFDGTFKFYCNPTINF